MQGKENDQGNTPTTAYNVSSERIFNEARNADNIMVVALKDGNLHLWSNKGERGAQELLTQIFPSAVLPEPERVS